jgi:hypothetical protein
MSTETHGGMMMLTEENSLFVHQSSLAILRAQSFGSKQEEWSKRIRIWCCKVLFKLAKRFLTRCKILRHGASGFTSPLMEGVLRIFITLKVQWQAQ